METSSYAVDDGRIVTSRTSKAPSIENSISRPCHDVEQAHKERFIAELNPRMFL